MPELKLCVYCKKSIDPDKDHFVAVESAAQDSAKFGEVTFPHYAHANCHDQTVGLIENACC